jgi:putative endonuclease
VKPYFYVYVLRLSGGSYYTGYARDPLRRLARHAAGRGSRIARSFRPLELAGCWRVRGGRSQAMRVEAFIKSRPRAAKELLLRDPCSLAASLRRATGLRLRPLPFLAAIDRSRAANVE